MADYNWNRYLIFANGLACGSIAEEYEEETKFRIAISRAYYAALNIAKSYLIKKDPRLFAYGGSTHKAVVDGFKKLAKRYNHNSTIYNQINTSLKGLRASRVNADYDANFKVSFDKAAFECERARGIIKKVNTLK